MAIAPYVPTIWVNDTAPARNATNLNKQETGINDVTNEVITLISTVDDLGAPVSIPFTPQVTAPTYTEGQVYYNGGTLNVQGEYSDVTLQIGREMHMEVINNSGAIIDNGKPVRHNGVLLGDIQIELAQADTLTNARVLGMTTHTIGIGEKGIITTFGYVSDVDTTLLTLGVPVYLSDTIAGGLTTTAPQIVSQVGGAITNGGAGQFFVSVDNVKALPNASAYMAGGSGTATIDTTWQDITTYTSSTDIIMSSNTTTGEILAPVSGTYKATMNVVLAFADIGNTDTSVNLRIVGDNGFVSGTIPSWIVRNGQGASMYPAVTIDLVANESYKLQISADTTITTVTYPLISFELETKQLDLT